MNDMKDTPKSEGVLEKLAQKVNQTFTDFGIEVEVVRTIEALRAYHIHLKTRKPVRMRAIKSFEDDLRYALGSDKVEIQAPIPDESLIGIRIPKKALGQLMLPWRNESDRESLHTLPPLTVPFGVGEFGDKKFLSIRDLPHVLIGGTVGSGKSVLLHSIISSLIRKHTPDELRFVLIDPKHIELVLYEGLPHLLTPPISDVRQALLALKWIVGEMERRFNILGEHNVRDCRAYHKKRAAGKLPESSEHMPYIVIVIDEIADLMSAYPQEFEEVIVRLAQMGRGAGIHLILATQRPTADVATGLIKANLPSRIALHVYSQVDSRLIIDVTGAEQLEGCGDLISITGQEYAPLRIQSYYISEEEVTQNVREIRKECKSLSGELLVDFASESPQRFSHQINEQDTRYEEAKRLVVTTGKASTALLQRKLGIGYSRSALLIDLLEHNGVIGPQNGSKPREILVEEDEL